MILLIDNYDSFSYNLYQLIGEINPDIKVIRNDEMTVEEIRQLKPERIILSPGPGRPEDAGVIVDVAKTLGKETEKSERSRNLYGCSKTFLHEKTNPWHLPGTSEHRSCIWSKNHSCKRTDAWKTVGGDV